MMVSVTLSPPGRHAVDQVRDAEPEVAFVSGDAASGGLRHESRLAAGVRLVVDPTAPARWRAVQVGSLDEAADPVVRALVGAEAIDRVTHRLRELRSGAAQDTWTPTVERMTVDPSKADPWLRVAATDALDRWLQLPLDQALVDAERGIARSRAAMTLPEDAPARQAVIADALEITRRASRGLAGYLNGLSKLKQPPPAGLLAALKQLVDGYDTLIGEVKGPDHDLRKVLTRWAPLGERATVERDAQERSAQERGLQERGLQERGLQERGSVERGLVKQTPKRPKTPKTLEATATPLQTSGAPGAALRLVSLIDPRQVRARVFAVTADPALAEVSMVEAAQVEGAGDQDEPLVLVKALAFGPVTVGSGFGARMLVRLVDRRSGQSRSEALLTLAPGRLGPEPENAGRLVFSSTVPLRGARIDDVRADVFDALSDVPPATADSDATLQNVRRAVLSLRELRQLIAETRMTSVSGRRIRLRKSVRDAALASTLGPGDLMVAELAAAHQAMAS